MHVAQAGTSIAHESVSQRGEALTNDCFRLGESRELSRSGERMEQARMARHHDRRASGADDRLCGRGAAVASRREARILARTRPGRSRRHTHGLRGRGIVRSAARARTLEASLSSAFGRSTDNRASRLIPGERSTVRHRFSGSTRELKLDTERAARHVAAVSWSSFDL